METDDAHATITESFSLVQNILFIKYTDIFTANFVFFMTYSGGNFWCPYLWPSPDTKVHEKNEISDKKRNVWPDDHNLNGCGKVKENGNFAPFHVPAISAFLSFAPQWLVVPISLNGLGKWREMAIEACAPQSGARAGILRWCNSEMVQFWVGTILRWYNSEIIQIWDGTILCWYNFSTLSR